MQLRSRSSRGWRSAKPWRGGGAAPAVTVTVWLAVPPAPLQLSVNVVVAESAAEVSLPLTGRDPLHPPEAVQLVAFVDDQFSAVRLPTTTVAGFAVNVTVGAAGPVVTVTCALLFAVPPVPVQLNVNVVDAVRPPITSAPLWPFAPPHPFEAVQLVAFVELQVTVVLPPLTTDTGLAEMVTTGSGMLMATSRVLVVVPPDPPQVSV